MKLSDLTQVRTLNQELEAATKTLAAFEAEKEEMVPVLAHTTDLRMGGHTVPLLPVPKAQAVSAAKREREKIVEELRNLGVEVD